MKREEIIMNLNIIASNLNENGSYDDLLEDDLLEAVEEINEAINPLLYVGDDLYYRENESWVLEEMIDGLDLVDVLRWVILNEYDPGDRWIKYSNFTTITTEQLGELYLENARAIIELLSNNEGEDEYE